MDIDKGAFVAYYRRAEALREDRRARLADTLGTWQRLSALKASALGLLCRLQLPVLEPACALGA